MKLLFLTPQLPFPPRQGTTIRNFNLIRHLAQRHTIDCSPFWRPAKPCTLTVRCMGCAGASRP
jgi:hypothetical protein